MDFPKMIMLTNMHFRCKNVIFSVTTGRILMYDGSKEAELHQEKLFSDIPIPSMLKSSVNAANVVIKYIPGVFTHG